MRQSLRSELLARLCLTIGALLPYWQLLGFDVVHITDDGFTSDIWNGELPARVELGALIAQGDLPKWTSQLCSGFPIHVGAQEPISLGLFSFFTPAVALDALLLVLVMVAAHGTYSLARRFGSTRPGAVLAGNAFAVCGYIVCQLKHLGIIMTIVWLPLALYLLDRGLTHVPRSYAGDTPPPPTSRASRLVALFLFGLVFGEQVTAGFPQSSYICALTYGAYALYVVLSAPHAPGVSWRMRLLPLAEASVIVLLGAAMGAASMLPLAELGGVSDRGGGNSYEWAVQLRYWPPNFLTFISPYIHGDISDGTYEGPSLFWEDYGYVGVATFFLAIYGSIADRSRGSTRFLTAMTVICYLLVLGPATPLFRVAFELIPGFKFFRCPTRFLIVVDLGLCLLAAMGLTRLQAPLGRALEKVGGQRALPVLIAAIVIGTTFDLCIHQPRQNAMVKAADWLDPPFTVRMIQDDPGATHDKRIFTPFHMGFHLAGNSIAKGWSDLRPYYFLRDLIEPNTNIYWKLPAADCYAGIAPRWHIDVWGDHNRGTLVFQKLLRPQMHEARMDAKPGFLTLMQTYGVTHVISPYTMPLLAPEMPTTPGFEKHNVHVYRIPDARRVRVAATAELVASTEQAIERLVDPAFDPDAVVLLHDAPTSVVSHGLPAAPNTGASASIERDDADELFIRANAPAGGFLLLADTFYPGWRADVDGQPTTIYRANISVRAIKLTPGEHRVRFHYEPEPYRLGLIISATAFGLLLSGLLVAWVMARRQRS